jgi:hypothetical protein
VTMEKVGAKSVPSSSLRRDWIGSHGPAAPVAVRRAAAAAGTLTRIAVKLGESPPDSKAKQQCP